MSVWLANSRQELGTAIPLASVGFRKRTSSQIFTSFFLIWHPSLFIESQLPHQMPIGIDTPSTTTSWLAADSHNSPSYGIMESYPPTLRLTYKFIYLGGSPSNFEFNKSFTLRFNSSKCIQTDFRNPLFFCSSSLLFSLCYIPSLEFRDGIWQANTSITMEGRNQRVCPGPTHGGDPTALGAEPPLRKANVSFNITES